MTEHKGRLDEPAVSEQDRAWMELDARMRKTIDVPVTPSRGRFGKFLNVLESIFRSSRPPNNWS